MLNIGEFARLGGVTTRTLRHYDHIGLLCPTEVDQSSGYRRYRAAQLGQLQRIVALKELGLSLPEIQSLLAELTADEAIAALKERRNALEMQIVRSQFQLADIDRRLRLIERMGAMPDYEITTTSLPATRFVAVIVEAPSVGAPEAGPALAPAFAELISATQAQEVTPTGAPFVVFEELGDGDKVRAFASVPVDDTCGAVQEPLTLCCLPPVDEAVSVTRDVPDLDRYSEIYAELLIWMEEHGWQHTGHGRDHIVEVDGMTPISWETQWPMHRVGDQAPDITITRL